MAASAPTLYSAELFYFWDTPDFPFRRAVEVTAATVARWSTHYYAALLAPRADCPGPRRRHGPLPASPDARAAFVADLVRWLFQSSSVDDVFALMLHTQPVPDPSAAAGAKFAHYDDTCCWTLSLTSDEFARLQDAWRAHGLPADLFYPADAEICVPYPGTRWWARLLRLFKVQKCFTPKQWEHARPAAEDDDSR